jgi:phenylacetate-CoA ligase
MRLTDHYSLRSPPGNAWPALPVPRFAPAWCAVRMLDHTQWLNPAIIVEGQLRQLRLLLTHCAQHVPYYADLLAQAGIEPESIRTLDDFRRLPLLRRETYQARAADCLARDLPPGLVEAGRGMTSGTTGVPIQVRYTSATQIWWLACYLRDLEWGGFDPRQRLATIRSFGHDHPQLPRLQEGVTLPHWHPALASLIMSGPAHGMDVRQDPRRQLDWLRRIAPVYLLSLPADLEFLGDLLKESGERLTSLRAIQSYDNTLTEQAQARIEAAFGVPVKNLYSSAEGGYLASSCPEGHGMHVHAENVLLEVLDDDGRPCRPGETGRVVLTTLHNFLTPFVRYEICDEATAGAERCPCGRGLPLLARVLGKVRPLFRLPDGGSRSPNFLVESIREVQGIRQQQLIQRAADHVVVRVVVTSDWSPESAAQVQRIVDEFFGGSVRLEVEVLDRLEQPPRGKLRDVVCEVGPPGTSPGG